jgi:Cu(I)-responsive transcriptional regulator
MNISDAAKAAGVSAKMVRHYEATGLLPPAQRSSSGYRVYSERDVSVLRFIRQSRRLGFSIAQIGQLLSLWSNPQRSSCEVKALAQQHLDELQKKLLEITEMKTALEQMVALCQGNDNPHCAIISELAAGSPSAPTVRTEHEAPKRPAARKKGTAKSQPSHGLVTAHADLTTWMHSSRSPGGAS